MNQSMAVFFDIDGTLLPNWRETIPDETMDAVHAAQANGHLCILNTGRALGTVDKHLLNNGFDGIISGVGTRGDLHGKLLWERLVTPEISRKVIEAARTCGIKVVYESNEATAYDTYRFPPTEAELNTFDIYRQMGRRVVCLDREDSFIFAKFIVTPERGGDTTGFFRMIEGFQAIDYRNGWYEVVPIGCDKGSAMLRMLDHLGMTTEQTIAVGDSENDVPMLRLTPNSVAMGNGRAKETPVSFVTLPCREGGIPHMLRHFGLID